MVRCALSISKNYLAPVFSKSNRIDYIGGGAGGGASGDSLNSRRVKGGNRRIVVERGGGGGRCSCTSHLA